jgi:mannose-1-phosphate guanylyltransferase
MQPIVGSTSMLAQTVDRLSALVPPSHIFVVTNREQREAILEDCPTLRPDHIVGEPVGRDTAAAVALATVLIKQRDPNGVFALLPADHVIHDAHAFCQILQGGFEIAEKEPVLVTVGIKPVEAATGYGYIERAQMCFKTQGGYPVYGVARFVEKPDKPTAQKYLDSGNYFWNAGMFVWSVPTIEEAFRAYAQNHYEALSCMGEALERGERLDLVLERHYPGLEKISIDYAVMEKAKNVVMIESAFDWDDVGEWPAVARHSDADASGNVMRGDVIVEGSKGNIVISPAGHLTALLGVEDLIVVHTADATLICPKAQAQSIKKLVQKIADMPRYHHHL